MKSTTVGVSSAILKALNMELRGGFCPYSLRTISIMLRYATFEIIDSLEPKRKGEELPSPQNLNWQAAEGRRHYRTGAKFHC